MVVVCVRIDVCIPSAIMIQLYVPPLPHSRVDLALPKQLLLALLPVAPSIIKLLSRHTQPRLSSIFYHFMLSCTILAATVEGGHLILVKAVEDWLPVCIQVLKDTDNSSSIDTIVLYLSELSSALSYATGVAGVTEKRGLAGEVECLVVDSDPESDDEGAGSGGLVGGDDDSAADESVSGSSYLLSEGRDSSTVFYKYQDIIISLCFEW